MKKVNNITRNKEAEIDKTSEYFRICPQCDKEFMADHMARKFCDEKCGDDYNNSKKRLLPKLDVNQVNNIAEPINQLENKPRHIEGSLAENLKILDSLTIDQDNGTYFHLEELDNKGFDFSKFGGRGKLYNIAKEFNCHFLQIGLYRLCLTEFSTLLIVKTINI